MAKEKRRRTTAVTCVEEEAEARRAFGAQELIRVMKGTKPQKGKSIHIISGGNVDLICHLRWLLDHYGHFDRIFLSCWAISAPDIMLLKRWHDHGELKEIDLLVGDVYPSNYKKEWEKLEELHEEGMINNLYHSAIHSKLMLLEQTDGECIVIESSANCNMNPRVEQSCVTVSRPLYEFYRGYFADLFAVEDGRERRLRMRAENVSRETLKR